MRGSLARAWRLRLLSFCSHRPGTVRPRFAPRAALADTKQPKPPSLAGRSAGTQAMNSAYRAWGWSMLHAEALRKLPRASPERILDYPIGERRDDHDRNHIDHERNQSH